MRSRETKPRRTQAQLAVAAAILADSTSRHYGYELSKAAGDIRSGVLYPMLQRWYEMGWLVDGWEDPAETAKEKRPPRRYYELTEEGRGGLSQLLASAPQPTGSTRRLGWGTA